MAVVALLPTEITDLTANRQKRWLEPRHRTGGGRQNGREEMLQYLYRPYL